MKRTLERYGAIAELSFDRAGHADDAADADDVNHNNHKRTT